MSLMPFMLVSVKGMTCSQEEESKFNAIRIRLISWDDESMAEGNRLLSSFTSAFDLS
jgi:hypothetical protein